MECPKTPNPRINATGEDSPPQKEPELQIVQTYKDDAFFQKVIAENHTEKGKHIAIIGEPGAGKTTLLGELAERLAKNSPNFPICIRLADLRYSTIADYLLNNWLSKALQFIDFEAENVTPEIRKSFKQLFAAGKVWLLLDGVDEMAATSPIEALARIREQLTDWVGKARVVLTCRLNVWDAAISNTLTDFDTYKTLEFEPDDVDEFIRQWFEEASQDEKRRNSGNETFWRGQGKRLTRQLKEPGKDNIRRMVRNPLRLSMLCQSWCVPEQELPETKAALYEQFTTYFFEWKQEEFSKKQRVLNQRDKKQIQQALAKLALAAMESVNRFRIEQDFAIEQMEEEWFNLADELGWLVLIDRDTRTKKPVYAFFHPTFQEYFAACAIEDWHFFLNHVPQNPKQGIYRIFEKQWKEVILLWFGREDIERKKKEQLIEALVEFDDNCDSFYSYKCYFIAAELIAEIESYSCTYKIINQILDWAFGVLVFNQKKESSGLKISFSRESPCSYALIEESRFALHKTKRDIVICLLTEKLHSLAKLDINLKNTSKLNDIDRESYQIIQDNIIELRVLFAYYLIKLEPGNQDANEVLTKQIKNLLQEIPENHNKESEQLTYKNIFKLAFCLQIACKLLEIEPHSLIAIETINKVSEVFLNKKIDFTKDPLISLMIRSNYSLVDYGSYRYVWEPTWSNCSRASIQQSCIEDIEEMLINHNITTITSTQDIHNYLVVNYDDESQKEALIEYIRQEIYPEIKAETRRVISKRELELAKIKFINVLTEDLYKNQDKLILCSVIYKLGKIGSGNLDVAIALIYLIYNHQDPDVRWQAIYSLKAILTENMLSKVVTSLKKCLQYSRQENDIDLYRRCDTVFWYCSQNLPYPDFYQAWHQDTLTNSATANLNIANLPQDLAEAINNQPELCSKVKLICIDTHQIIDPENPAPEIYDLMLNQNCPEWQNGYPETMQKLKLYWNYLRRISENPLFFICYDSTALTATPTGFSVPFLTALSKFDGAICVVTSPPNPLSATERGSKNNSPSSVAGEGVRGWGFLQTFSPTQPNLIADIVGWMREKMMENL